MVIAADMGSERPRLMKLLSELVCALELQCRQRMTARASQPMGRRTVFVKNLPYDADEEVRMTCLCAAI